jgi:hypothetical protein
MLSGTAGGYAQECGGLEGELYGIRFCILTA